MIEPAEEGDVAARADADVARRTAPTCGVKRGSTWISVAPFSFAFIGQRKPTGMGLGHVRAHEQDAVAVGQVLLVVGGRAAAERGAQTGHRGAMSYPGLVLDGDHAQAAAEQLLDQVVLLVVDRRPAEGADASAPS